MKKFNIIPTLLLVAAVVLIVTYFATDYIPVGESSDIIDTTDIINKTSKVKYLGMIEANDEDLITGNDSLIFKIFKTEPEVEYILVPEEKMDSSMTTRVKLYMVDHALLQTGTYTAWVEIIDKEDKRDTTTIQINYKSHYLNEYDTSN